MNAIKFDNDAKFMNINMIMKHIDWFELYNDSGCVNNSEKKLLREQVMESIGDHTNMIMKHIDWFELCNDCDYANIQQRNIFHEEVMQFIRSNQDYVDWDYASQIRASESFIREFQNKMNWREISLNQNISEEFAKEFQHKIYPELFKRNAMRNRN